MSKKRKVKKAALTKEQTRIEQEQLLKAKTIPSGKVYKRKPKHPKSGD